MDLREIKVGDVLVWFRSRKGHNYSCELIESRVIAKSKKTVRVEYKDGGIIKRYSVLPERLERIRN